MVGTKKMKDLFEKHKLMRRISLIWVLILITFVLERVTRPEIIVLIQTPGASIIIAVIGMLATIVGFYMSGRAKEEGQSTVVEDLTSKVEPWVSSGKRIMPKRRRRDYHDRIANNKDSSE